MNVLPKFSPVTFNSLWDMGFRNLLPIIPPDAEISERSSLSKRVGTKQDGRGKTPGVRGTDGKWSSFDWTQHRADERDLARWSAMAAGIGIKTGDLLLAIDADTLDRTYAGNILMTVVKHFGFTPARIGHAPKALFLIRLSAPMKYTRVDFGDNERVECLSDGRQFVAQGMHPKTKLPYVWTTPLVPFDQLPIFSPAQVMAFLEELRTILPAAKPIVTEGAATDIQQSTLRGHLDVVAKAVKATPNKSAAFETREAYRDYGYAIKAALPDNEPEAFELFADWCQRWEDGTNDPDIVAADWRRMKPPYRRGASWIYELAELHNPTAFRKVDLFFDVIDEPESLFENGGAVSVPRSDIYKWYRASDIVSREPIVYLAARHIPEVSFGFLYSDPGAGKSFLALDLALHIACGAKSWHGDAIKAADDRIVVYLAAEGAHGFRNRIVAWHVKNGLPTYSDRFILIEQPINFMREEDIDKLLRTVRDSIGAQPALIVVDTVSRAAPGTEENSVKDMSLFVRACDRLKDAYSCAVLGVHHANKQGGGLRGSTALLGAADFIFKLTRNKGASIGKLHCEKQKDGADGWIEDYRFDLVTIDVGQSSLVPSRCQLSVADGKALAQSAKERVLEAIGDAWSAGEPWGRTPRSKDAYAVLQLMARFGFDKKSADALLQHMLEAGEIEDALHNTNTKRRGLRVIAQAEADDGSDDPGTDASGVFG